MKRLYYDLHNHSCLSPCADNDSTPNNIAGMASLCGINVMALTDHNTCKNCPAFFEAADRYGIIPIAGMELTTSEDIHVVFLFDELRDAMRFDEAISKRRVLIKNRPDIFGEQLILDGEDNVIGKDEHLLSNATTVSVEEVQQLAKEYGAVCYPAHVDRESNGIIAVLGVIPEHLNFRCVEIYNKENIPEYRKRYIPDGVVTVIGSDSHCLTDMRDGENYFELDTDTDDISSLRRQLLDLLR
ncbi:MAG: PHP domain-containing protein [Clostridia bacterium]|nr:PHP domain-containing protein [Clostridia bacterium]